ncbi:MAG: tRNA epoxyqueuosine(34) reductase QueG [Rikenellaceae bacterium]
MNNLFPHLFIINRAKKLGFDICGAVQPTYTMVGNLRVDSWIKAGYNGTMEWFNRNRELRYNPSLLLEENRGKTLILCGISYQLRDKNSIKCTIPFSAENCGEKLTPLVASYSYFNDYHFTLKTLLCELYNSIAARLGRDVEHRIFVDSAPLLERHWAVEAGFGWIGRNGLVVNRQFGSYFFIGSLLLDLELDSYSKADNFNGCGNCRRCVEGCKSGAILDNGVVDSNRCLSYITIEHKLPFTDRQREIIRLWNSTIFGCDACQSVCPWNIKAMKAITPEIEQKRCEILKFCTPPVREQGIEGYQIPKLSPLKRAGRKRLNEILSGLSV